MPIISPNGALKKLNYMSLIDNTNVKNDVSNS
jgi:hypothetical protein